MTEYALLILIGELLPERRYALLGLLTDEIFAICLVERLLLETFFSTEENGFVVTLVAEVCGIIMPLIKGRDVESSLG